MSIPRLPEQELVLLCARTHVDAGTRAKIQSLAQTMLDWNEVIETASRHGLLPLLYLNLNRYSADHLPASVLADLRDQFLLNTQRNLMLTRELLAVLAHLRQDNISVISFKGPLLAITAYGDLSLREIADVDLIVSPRDLRRARDVLLEQHYCSVHPMDPVAEEIFLRSNCALTLVRENPRVVLDLHWDLTPKYFSVALDLEAMQARLTFVSLGGVSVRTFCAEDLLLILCVHGARHVWERLDWLVSVAELVRASALDWDAVMGRARACKCERMLLLGLALACQLLDAELPAPIQVSIAADRVVSKLSAEIMTRLWHEQESRPNFFEETFVDELHPLMFNRWRERMRYYAALFFSPSVGDVSALHLPPRLSMAYYLIRPIRLLIRFGPRWLKQQLPSHSKQPVDTRTSQC